jgi:hypothetical protein
MEADWRVAAINVHRIISRAAGVDEPAASKKRSTRTRAVRGASNRLARDKE